MNHKNLSTISLLLSLIAFILYDFQGMVPITLIGMAVAQMFIAFSFLWFFVTNIRPTLEDPLSTYLTWFFRGLVGLSAIHSTVLMYITFFVLQ